MQAPHRRQEVIDDLTMRIERNDVKGSGFIQFPPQRPFAEKLERQPPTLSHQANPELYQRSSYNPPPQRYNGNSAGRDDARPQHAAYASGPSSHQARPPAQQYRSAQQPAPQYRPSHPPAPTYQQPQYRPAQQPSHGHDPPRAHQASYGPENGASGPGHGYSGGRGAPPGRGAAPGRGGFNGRGRGAGPAAAAPGRGGTGQPAPGSMQHAVRPPPAASQPRPSALRPESAKAPVAAPPPRAPPSDTGSEPHEKLSKSQLKRLMKKKREGKL